MLKINTIKQIITPEIGARLDSTRSNAMHYTGDWVGWMAGIIILMVPNIKVTTMLLYTILS